MGQTVVTVGQFYERWIETKREPIVRRSTVQDYRHHFKRYILPVFDDLDIRKVALPDLAGFKSRLLTSGLSAKTTRNIIDASFRSLWRDAMAEEIVTNNPFAALKWVRAQRSRPDPFTAKSGIRSLPIFVKMTFSTSRGSIRCSIPGRDRQSCRHWNGATLI